MSTVGDGRATGAVRLRPPEHPIDLRAVRWWALQALAVAVPALAGLVVVGVTTPSARPWVIPLAVVVTLAGIVAVVVVPRWRYAVHRWETSEEAVFARTGWIVHEWRVAPISRIQTVDTTRGPLERSFGLSTLVVTTASSRGSIHIVGLDEEVARRAAAHLTEITELTPGDQT